MHSLNYFHTDVRKANIVKFGDKFSLVDFGLAISAGTTIDLTTRSKSVRQFLLPPDICNSDRYLWKGTNDVDMLVRSLFFKDG